MTSEKRVHDKHIMDLQMSEDGTHFVTASLDRCAKIVDAESLQVLKSYETKNPANSAAISPIVDQVTTLSVGNGYRKSKGRAHF